MRYLSFSLALLVLTACGGERNALADGPSGSITADGAIVLAMPLDIETAAAGEGRAYVVIEGAHGAPDAVYRAFVTREGPPTSTQNSDPSYVGSFSLYSSGGAASDIVLPLDDVASLLPEGQMRAQLTIVAPSGADAPFGAARARIIRR